jgi:GNAT superfamily N-acetyltransferase
MPSSSRGCRPLGVFTGKLYSSAHGDLRLSSRLPGILRRHDVPKTTKPAIMAHSVRRLFTVTDAQIRGLAELLIDCVEGGASVSFMHPLPMAKALDFWRQVAAGVAQGERALLVAEDAQGTVGTVQLVFGQPENQPHRADLSKMLVHRRARRRGLGAALLREAERVARDCRKTLLVLDTASGDAERLYARLGWQRCGVIPGYALLPRGGFCDTTYFYRALES